MERRKPGRFWIAWWQGCIVTPRGYYRKFVLHPDGKHIALLKDPRAKFQPRVNKVTLSFNFSDEVRRVARQSRK